jgi:hypothetical protein
MLGFHLSPSLTIVPVEFISIDIHGINGRFPLEHCRAGLQQPRRCRPLCAWSLYIEAVL